MFCANIKCVTRRDSTKRARERESERERDALYSGIRGEEIRQASRSSRGECSPGKST